jgi:hypothetical protein
MACWVRGDHQGRVNSEVHVTGHTDEEGVNMVEFTWNGCGLSNLWEKQSMQSGACTAAQTPTVDGTLHIDLKFYRDGSTVVHTEGFDCTVNK